MTIVWKIIDFLTYLKHHVMSISPWLKNIFMIMYPNQQKIFQETDIFNVNGCFQKLNQYKISSPILYRLLRFGEKKICSKKAAINVLVISREVSLKSFNKYELKNILSTFPDFIINLKYLAVSKLTISNVIYHTLCCFSKIKLWKK